MGCTEPQSGSISSTWCQSVNGSDLLDDMEDGDGKLCGDQGQWDVAISGAVTTSPAAGMITTTDNLPSDLIPTDGRKSSRALHFTGSGFMDASSSAVLRASASLDLSKYSEIQFWAWSAIGIKVRVNVPSVATLDASGGGTCASSADPTMPCLDHFGAPEDLGSPPSAWTQISVPLVGLVQEGFGQPSTEDLADTRGIEIKFALMFKNVPGYINPQSFDFWIDDLQLVP